MDSARIPQGSDPNLNTACVDAKRLRCSSILANHVSKVLDDNNSSSWMTPVPPLDDENLLQEILLRLPPQPSSLPRASLVCKRWRSIFSDPQFLCRFRKHHHEPPLLGFFIGHIGVEPVFTAVLDSPNHIPPARFSVPRSHRPCDQWVFMGCRHGLAILINKYEHEVVVWDPLTDQQHHVPFPLGFRNNKRGYVWCWHAAVLGADAEDEHVHGACFSSPFKVVLVCGEYTQTFAFLYESVSGLWGNIVSTVTTDVIHPIRSNILVGNAVYWSFFGGDILVFDTEKQTLGVIEKPADAHITDYWSFQLLRTNDDGGLGLAVMSKLSIQLWERKSHCDGVVIWVLQKTIQLEGFFTTGMHRIHIEVRMVGYDEDSNMIVLTTHHGDFMFQLDLMWYRAISKRRDCFSNKTHYPYRNFYTAGRGVGWKWLDQNT